VRALVRLGMKGLDNVKGASVHVKPSHKHAHGQAGWGRITIWLPPPHRFPMSGWKRHRSSPLNHDWQDWREALVALAAHEGRHLDLDSPRRKRRWSQQRIEMNCEAWEHGVLKEYRAS
jgi:hypothetical protein